MTGMLKRVSPRMLASTIGLALLALVASGCGSSGGASSASSSSTTPAASTSASSLAPIHGPYKPSIDPSDFVATVDNRYWPLKPGMAFHYKGVRGTTPQTDDEVVTTQTKRI